MEKQASRSHGFLLLRKFGLSAIQSRHVNGPLLWVPLAVHEKGSL